MLISYKERLGNQNNLRSTHSCELPMVELSIFIYGYRFRVCAYCDFVMNLTKTTFNYKSSTRVPVLIRTKIYFVID